MVPKMLMGLQKSQGIPSAMVLPSDTTQMAMNL
jgi:hypothetical protein